MAMFPKLTTGVVTQCPAGRRATYSTCVTRFLDGSEQRFRELKVPVRRWAIRLSEVSASEIAEIELLYASMLGEFGSFTFVDPWDGVEHQDCSFEQDALSVSASADALNQTYLVIRNNAL